MADTGAGQAMRKPLWKKRAKKKISETMTDGEAGCWVTHRVRRDRDLVHVEPNNLEF